MPRTYRLGDIDAYSLPKPHIAIIPVGSIEQHDNLPLATDTMIAECIASHIADRLSRTGSMDVIIYPAIAYGFSPEWAGTPGTVSLPLDALYNTLLAIAESATRSGARIVVYVNGHGGNNGVLAAAAATAASGGIPVAVIDYQRLLRNCGSGPVGHACRVERAILWLCGVKVPAEPVEAEERDVVSEIHMPGTGKIYAVNPPGSKPPGEEAFNCTVESAVGIILDALRGVRRGMP